jgi:Na+/H+ antiporter NhaC
MQSALRIGTVAGVSMAAVGVLYHSVEMWVSLPASVAAVLGASMWGAMFLAFGSACSATFRKERSIGLGVLASVWSGMMYAAVLVACALAFAHMFMPHMEQVLVPLYRTSGVHDPRSFVVRHEVGAAGAHLLLVPVVASFVGLVSGAACWLLSSIRWQAVVALGLVAMLIFAAGVLSIRFAASLERAQRPPFIVFGLAALAVTLAAAHPLFISICRPRSPREIGS